MTEYEFDLSDCYSPEDVHRAIAERLPLPEYYGGNLDALYDVLTEPRAKWRLTFTGCATASAVVGGKYMRQLKKMCERATAENSELEVIFIDN